MNCNGCSKSIETKKEAIGVRKEKICPFEKVTFCRRQPLPSHINIVVGQREDIQEYHFRERTWEKEMGWRRTLMTQSSKSY